jgi:hydroxymethylglutaryl-CoA reductase
MNRAHALLGEFELSTAAIDAMVEAARARGALGAKLTGAGGGGAVIALCPGEESEIERAWKDLGFEAFVCQVGVKS